ncbi:MAG: alpha/beta hydrolase [Prosthecobacter sp.]
MRLLVFFLLGTTFIRAQDPAANRALADVSYKTGDSLTEYERERCKLDVYLPSTGKDWPVLVWFHGGGLKNGDKRGTPQDGVKTERIVSSLANAGIAVVSVNYRFSPKVTFPAYLEDGAAAVAWTQKHITEHGGDSKRIFIGGHSAGGYIALMLGADARYLANAGVKLTDIAGLIPVSGQTLTHYTVREERGGAKYHITADDASPLHYCGPNTPPFLVLYADRDMAARAEENLLFVEMMKAAGNKGMRSLLVKDRTHGSIASKIADDDDPARVAILEFMSSARAN